MLVLLRIAFIVDAVQGSRVATHASIAMKVQQEDLIQPQTVRRAAGRHCSGPLAQWVSSSCPSEHVTDVEGQKVSISLQCFARGGRSPDQLASWGEDGVCLIPQGEQCDDDRQCRHGTSCMLRGDAYRCQEVPADSTLDNGGRAEVARSAAAAVRSMAARLSESELLSGDTPPSTFQDAGSGAFSPFVVKPALLKLILSALETSFEYATVKGKTPASRSGALFLVSGDKRFMSKTVKKSEYEEFVHHLVGPLAQHADLANATCQSASMVSCWAEAMLNRTCLNVPVLAFVHDGRYWVVMGSSAHMRGLAVSGSVADLEPWGEATYYDVKPVWAKSAARESFMQKLAEMGMGPTEEDAPPEQQAQWEDLRTTIENDLDFLSQEGTDKAPFIDYSLLFEIYTPGQRVDVKGQHCLEARSCFSHDPAGCHVLCVSIIDYFMRFTFGRKSESWWKKFKFHDYAKRTKQLLECPLSQKFPGGDGLKVNGEAVVALPADGVIKVEIEVDYLEKYMRGYCEPYLSMMCNGLGAREVERLRTKDCMWDTGGLQCYRATCTWALEARYLDQCTSWLQYECESQLKFLNDVARGQDRFD